MLCFTEFEFMGCVLRCMCLRMHVGACEFGLQVPMVDKGVVEVLVATLVAVQDAGAPALDVQQAVCNTLWNLTDADENLV